NGLWCGTDPQEARFLVVLDRRIEDLREKRHERVVPTDDHCAIWVLRGDTIATHTHLPSSKWCGAVVSASVACAVPVHQVPSATGWLFQVAWALCRGCITTACWAHHHVSRRLGTSPARTRSFTNVAKRRSATTYKRTLSAARRCWSCGSHIRRPSPRGGPAQLALPA